MRLYTRCYVRGRSEKQDGGPRVELTYGWPQSLDHEMGEIRCILGE